MSEPGMVHREPERAQIAELTRQWFEAERRRDLSACLSYLSPDVILQPEGAPQMQGLEAASELWTEFFAVPFVDLIEQTRIISVAAGGDMAFDAGVWSIVLEDETGQIEQPAKSLIVWQKAGTGWKAVALTFSMNAAPSSPG